MYYIDRPVSMALPPAAGETTADMSRSTRTWSSSSSSNSSTVSMSSEEAVQVGVAVGKEVKECKANLMWVLSNMDALTSSDSNGGKKKKVTVVLLHIHRPAKTIPFMGAKFPAEQLHEAEVSAFRQAETQAMHRAMARYRAICGKVKVQAVCKVETTTVDGDVAQGILRLAAQHGIRRLVMGAAADKRYSKKMTAPSSKTALSLQQHASPLYHIWFLCKGRLICTIAAAAAAAESPAHALALATSHTTTRSAAPPEDDYEFVSGSQQVQLGTFIQMSMSSRNNSNFSGGEPLPPPPPSVPCSQLLLHGDAGAYTSSSCYYYDKEQQQQDTQQSIFGFAEHHPRPSKMVMMMQEEEDLLHQKVVASLEAQVLSSKRMIQDLQDKLSEAHCMLFSMEREQDDLRRQRDAAIRQLHDVKRLEQEEKTLPVPVPAPAAFIHLSYDDLQEAMDGSLGQAGGGVYRAVLRRGDGDMEVAVKLLNPALSHLDLDLQRVEELSKLLRHPNVVPLLGACLAPEACALVYEYLPGGSLEDRLALRLPLVFLHQNCSLVHGDLKPANVLLLDGGGCKLADSGLWRLLEPGAGAALLSVSASTVAYMDPELLASGELRPSSDRYTFGVLLLRLLTGQPAMGLVKLVRAALAEGRVPDILDASAGEWPYQQQQAVQLAHLGVTCCEMASRDRPDLAGDMMIQALGWVLPAPAIE